MKNITYASLLATIAINGCAPLSGVANPEVRAYLRGTYEGKIDRVSVTYKVEKERCTLLAELKLSPLEIRTIYIEDTGCDNTADFATDKEGELRSRDYFMNNPSEEKIEKYDSILVRGQKLVQPENKAE